MRAIPAATPLQTTSHAASPEVPLLNVSQPSTLFLDGMRGLAALYVLLRHVTWVPAADTSGPAWRGILRMLEHAFRYGHLAVIFFFVLSGFVIHLRFAKQIQKSPATATFGWGEFVYRRIRRLYPPLLAAILITWLCDRAGTAMGFYHFYTGRGVDFSALPDAMRYNHRFPTLLGNLTFIMQMHAQVWGTDNPLWSLAYEWWFYMLYPLLWRLSRRSIALATGFVFIAFLLTRLPGAWPGIQDGTYPFSGWGMLSLPRRVFAALPAWWCGVLLADIYAGRLRISFKSLAPLTLALGAMFISGVPEAIKAALAGIGFCGAISLGFYLQQQGLKLTLLNKLKGLGDFSYTLYVTHWPLVIFLTPWWARHAEAKFPGSAPMGLVFLTVVPLVIAYVAHLFVEKPFTRSHKPKPLSG